MQEYSYNSPKRETTQLSIKYTKQTNRALWYSHDTIPHNEKELTTTICNIMDKSQKTLNKETKHKQIYIIRVHLNNIINRYML